jgi:hypothetical protein
MLPVDHLPNNSLSDLSCRRFHENAYLEEHFETCTLYFFCVCVFDIVTGL